MSDEPDETYPLTLGARRWELPNFTFGVIRRLQPRLLRLNRPLAKVDAAEAAFHLDEKTIEEMLGIVAAAIHEVDPEVTLDYLDRLRFLPAELIGAQAAVMQACGMIRRAAGAEEGADDPKASASTTSSPA